MCLLIEWLLPHRHRPVCCSPAAIHRTELSPIRLQVILSLAALLPSPAAPALRRNSYAEAAEAVI
jgi:hypothetical protein